MGLLIFYFSGPGSFSLWKICLLFVGNRRKRESKVSKRAGAIYFLTVILIMIIIIFLILLLITIRAVAEVLEGVMIRIHIRDRALFIRLSYFCACALLKAGKTEVASEIIRPCLQEDFNQVCGEKSPFIQSLVGTPKF